MKARSGPAGHRFHRPIAVPTPRATRDQPRSPVGSPRRSRVACSCELPSAPDDLARASITRSVADSRAGDFAKNTPSVPRSVDSVRSRRDSGCRRRCGSRRAGDRPRLSGRLTKPCHGVQLPSHCPVRSTLKVAARTTRRSPGMNSNARTWRVEDNPRSMTVLFTTSRSFAVDSEWRQRPRQVRLAQMPVIRVRRGANVLQALRPWDRPR